MFSRARFQWNLPEISGSLGDLGTFLPHIIAAVTVVGMDPTGILVCFGLAYALSGAFYGIPMAVQPMKAASAAVLIEPMDPGAVVGAGIVIGLFFLIIGASGAITKIARVLPPTIAAGLQLGLGLSLGALGIRMITADPWFGVVGTAFMLLFIGKKRLPVALIAVVLGAAVGLALGTVPMPPPLEVGLHLPHVAWPTWAQVVHGTEYAVLPQIPLTLTNAILVTAAVSRQLFPKELHPANERNLALTTGAMNLLAAPFGGYLMCHGAGGIVGHHRFGARTATAPVLIGVIFLALGLLFGSGGYAVLRTIPEGVLGALLLLSGIELAQSSKPQSFAEADLFLVLAMAVVCVALNPAIAFAAGLPVAYAIQKGWIRI